MRSKWLLLTLGVLFAAPSIYALITLNRTATAPWSLKLTLLGVLPVLSVVALAAGLRGGNNLRVNTSLALLALLFALYLAELLLPLMLQVRDWVRLASLRQESLDRRDKIQVVLDARAQGVPAVPTLEPRNLLQLERDSTLHSRLADNQAELLPVSGVANRHTVACNESGQWVTYESDRYGMNNPDTVWTLDSLEIATVGDSFTTGWCVSAEHQYVTLIRRRYPATVNLAQSGNGPLLILASIMEYLPQRRPKKVLWFHFEGNDFHDLAIESRAPLLRGYLEGGRTQGLAGRQDAIDREVTAFIETDVNRWRNLRDLAVGRRSFSLSAAAIMSFVKLDHVRDLLGAVYPDPFIPDLALWTETLTKARAVVQEWGGKVYLVYLPASDRYQRMSGSHTYAPAYQGVLGSASALDIPVIDVHRAFLAHGRPLSLYIPIKGYQYGHFSEEGNRVVASAVAEGLRPAEGR